MTVELAVERIRAALGPRVVAGVVRSRRGTWFVTLSLSGEIDEHGNVPTVSEAGRFLDDGLLYRVITAARREWAAHAGALVETLPLV